MIAWIIQANPDPEAGEFNNRDDSVEPQQRFVLRATPGVKRHFPSGLRAGGIRKNQEISSQIRCRRVVSAPKPSLPRL